MTTDHTTPRAAPTLSDVMLAGQATREAAGYHDMSGLTGVPCHCSHDGDLMWHYTGTATAERVALEGGDLVMLCGHGLTYEPGAFRIPDERDGVLHAGYFPPGVFRCTMCGIMRHGGAEHAGIRTEDGAVRDRWWNAGPLTPCDAHEYAPTEMLLPE